MALEDKGPLNGFGRRLIEFFRGRPGEIETTLTLAECMDRLNAGMDSNLVLFGKRPVIGEASEAGGVMRMRAGRRNSFQTLLSFDLIETPKGCRIPYRAGMSMFASLFMLVWFGGILSTVLPGLAAGIRTGHVAPLPLLFVGFMLAFGVGLVALGRSFARSDETLLTGFIVRATNGRIVR